MILSDDQRALQEGARRFARERLLPDYQRRERSGILDRELLLEMGRLGLMGVELPERLGGLGLDAVTTGLIAEELAYGDFNVSLIPVGTSLNAAILVKNAQPDLVERWVPRMIRGEALVAICLTEPRGGSDAANLQVRARRDGDHYVINGEKTSITFADRADAYIVFARSGEADSGAKGVSAFFIPADSPGIQRTAFDDVGSAIAGRGSVFFDDVKVPVDHRLAEERLRRDPPVPADLRSLRLVQGSSASTAHARRDGAGDRRRHGRHHEVDHRAGKGRQGDRAVPLTRPTHGRSLAWNRTCAINPSSHPISSRARRSSSPAVAAASAAARPTSWPPWARPSPSGVATPTSWRPSAKRSWKTAAGSARTSATSARRARSSRRSTPCSHSTAGSTAC